MHNLASLFEAVQKIQEREKQAPSNTAIEMFERTQSALSSELDDTDYFYLAVFMESLVASKKFSTANDLPFEHLGLVAHALSESRSNGS